ncbi:cysteinyl-tRNA synthetase [Acetoanaerobium noterae]|uniref:Cysteine--tRNA ligase n=1 Tax=Acetoanaerobium noterae TaxID=745369 RepID=A0A1T5DDD0_9FIRM|nr:cysteine--tRNA ligase [Acetoanaerobium noterae]MBP8762560.1 cysteine--tRNA ligase [Acetoanaerobium sp.]MBP9562210.1 cysteine--tRNA ligase [Acetoanaerobium sp.]SKB69587.1 cysteinyl-tRNA synthetase [Acetoanaerobium noterae]
MKIYNTLTRQKETFIPLEENKIKMYVCGPTVYNFFHIGNARPFMIFDAFRNYMEYRGYEVTYVQNFTDVDDKIIKRANEEGISPIEVAEKYIAEYFKDADALGIKRATVHPRVTENIENIITFIEDLISKGFAYELNGDVYFNSQAYKEYGKLSKQNLEELNLGARIDVNDEKKHPIDFALWKAKKEGEIGWQSPWGEGRPGWHIECSVMSARYLGDTIDIHAGGQDLIFPHHENEIAQSEARSGKQFARYWMHNGYINVDNQKMSKSLGNFFTVRDILSEFSGQVIRFFLLSAHYRNPVNFSKELILQAKAGMERLANSKERLVFTISHAKGQMNESELELVSALENHRDRFIEAMDDDINTADAISIIFELARFSNTNVTENSSLEWAEKNLSLFNELTGVLNIIKAEDTDSNDNEQIEKLIKDRVEAKKNKDFALADAIRDELKSMGIEIEDTRQGTKWKKIN